MSRRGQLTRSIGAEDARPAEAEPTQLIMIGQDFGHKVPSFQGNGPKNPRKKSTTKPNTKSTTDLREEVSLRNVRKGCKRCFGPRSKGLPRVFSTIRTFFCTSATPLCTSARGVSLLGPKNPLRPLLTTFGSSPFSGFSLRVLWFASLCVSALESKRLLAIAVAMSFAVTEVINDFLKPKSRKIIECFSGSTEGGNFTSAVLQTLMSCSKTTVFFRLKTCIPVKEPHEAPPEKEGKSLRF